MDGAQQEGAGDLGNVDDRHVRRGIYQTPCEVLAVAGRQYQRVCQRGGQCVQPRSVVYGEDAEHGSIKTLAPINQPIYTINR